jgi:Tfp pilus assembly protein PilF
MSLLLEALKKAELAKQSATTTPEPALVEPVITRDTLPDISQALQIEPPESPAVEKHSGPSVFDAPSEEIPPLAPSPAPEMMSSARPETARAVAPEPQDFMPDTSAGMGSQHDAEANRAAARQVFEAKENNYNPKRPFYITLGVLGLFAAGYAGYVWWEMQPKTVYKASAAKPAEQGASGTPAPAPAPAAPAQAPANSTPAAAPVTAPAGQAQPAPQAGQAAPPVTPAIAGTPAATSAAPSAQRDRAGSPPPAPASASGTVGATAQPRAAARAASPRPALPRGEDQRAGSPIAVNPAAVSVDPQIERAYDAFQRGDLATARSQYQASLQRDPLNRDALLGLAAIDMRSRQFDLAESRYLRLLELDPRDAHAQAGLIALRGQTDPVQSESRLKTLIAQQPDAAHLHFALGNQYAVQSRWPEAQAAYFKAFTLDSESPDFAFNLAVSLDQLRQTRLALDYYRRAISLSNTRAGSFDRSQVTTRINELSR